MDLDAVRTFVAVADAGQFSAAAAALAVSQQAVSKRVAALEQDLGVALFTRTSRGARLTPAGQAFLPPARDLLRAGERAAASVRPGRRALRVDVIGTRLAPAHLLREFHRAHPRTPLEVVRLFDVRAAIEAVQTDAIDASFRAVPGAAGAVARSAWPVRPVRSAWPVRSGPDGIETARVFDEPVQLLTGPRHALAGAGAVTMAQLAGHRIWMPTLDPGTEWTAFYDDLAAAFGLSIEVTGPDFGTEPLLDVVAESAELATLVGQQTHLVWPARFDLRRVSLRDPVPVYPHSLIWRAGNPHPALRALRGHLSRTRPDHGNADAWTPEWAHG
ncbi:MAG TPA: LysR family transcriptional regulator [Streptosporangiaceae bacterium]|jgi:DNA-binding transcriptional LysR family regulator